MPHMIQAPGAFISGFAIFLIVLWDAFEAIILPRRVTRSFALHASFIIHLAHMEVRDELGLLPQKPRIFAGLLRPVVIPGSRWRLGCRSGLGFWSDAIWRWLRGIMTGGQPSFQTDMYLSGTTFFTLGLGDVIPRSGMARVLVVVEGGFGFGFLAAVIGYLPFIYGSFSKREVDISLLDSRAGTPPTAGELLRRHSYRNGQDALRELLKDWEHWCAELMESHLSYPVLAYFRSQHDNQSWIASLTAILDTSALVMVGIEGACEKQAELTFAIARHAVVDLSQVFGTAPGALPSTACPPQNCTVFATSLPSTA